MQIKRKPCPAKAKPLALAVLSVLAVQAQAGAIDVGNPDLDVRWDNTVKYSNAYRVHGADDALLDNANTDDGDRNFDKGLISNRFDIFSELDAVWQQSFGARVSGAAYYDSVYNNDNDNPGLAGGAFPNQTSVDYDEFNDKARDDHGRKVELLDAFVFGRFDVADASVTARAGKHSLVWGESLFFGGNAIAGGMMPVDAIKLASVPGTQFKEAIRPVQQLSTQVQLTPDVSIGAYYQFDWQRSRVPTAGSYFASADMAVGGERLFFGPVNPFTGEPFSAPRGDSEQAKDNGQGGLQLRYRGEDTDYGFYAIRYHSKTPQIVPVIGLINTPFGPQAAPTSYHLAYQEGITAFGASASRTFDTVNLAVEGSIRHNMDLASTHSADTSFFGGQETNNSDHPAYALGKTAHVNMSMLATLPRTALWNEANLMGEMAWNRVLSVTKNRDAIDQEGTRDGFAMRVLLEPTYRSVFPGVDISVPLGMSWAPKGSRPLASENPAGWVPEGGGDMSIGLNGSFRDAWRFTLAYTHYYGDLGQLVDDNGDFTWKQSLKDRDFISTSLRYSF